jgi:transcriptional regulator with PAS, ATPase and Fis domain
MSFLFVLLDCDRPWAGASRFTLAGTDEVTIGRGSKNRCLRETANSTRRLALTLPTATLSSKHVRLLRVGDDWAIQDRGSRNGTWLNNHRIDYDELSDRDVFQVGRTFFIFRRYMGLESGSILTDILEEAATESQPSLVSLSPEISLENQSLRSIAQSSLAVLILGSTGTGKELTAKAIHDLSGRSGQFCAVNCGAIPTGLVESVLFGHVKGAFSGAVTNQLGVIRAADEGTLFLDEIGDLAPPAQAALLRVLQESEVVPIGGSQPIPVNLRIISATHQPLQDLVQEGRFRADLYARTAGYVHQLRPLESRLEDFGLLFGQLLRRAAADATEKVTITTEAGWALLRHPWSLNIRELEQAIARAVVLGKSGPLALKHFPFVLTQPGRSESGFKLKEASAELALRQQLDELLREHQGNVTAVARALGKGPTQVQRWLKRLGLVADAYRLR